MVELRAVLLTGCGGAVLLIGCGGAAGCDGAAGWELLLVPAVPVGTFGGVHPRQLGPS